MSDQQFDIIFRGDIVFGHQLADVKLKLQQLFKADAAKVDALFSGRPVPLKRGLDGVSAQKYKEALIKAGAQVDIVAASDIKPAAIARPATSAEPVASLAQRLQQQTVVENDAAEKLAKQREQMVRETVPQPIIKSEQSSWSLAPVGSDLLKPTEKIVTEPLIVDISSISLRPEGGNILDASEQPPVFHTQVAVPNFGIAEIGANMVNPDEKLELPLLELELADWTLGDLGEDLISQSEKALVVVPVIPDLNVGLAPAGADLGQLKPKVNVLIPDTSRIRLAD